MQNRKKDNFFLGWLQKFSKIMDYIMHVNPQTFHVDHAMLSWGQTFLYTIKYLYTLFTAFI